MKLKGKTIVQPTGIIQSRLGYAAVNKFTWKSQWINVKRFIFPSWYIFSGCREVGKNLLYVGTRLKVSQLLEVSSSGTNLFLEFLASEERLMEHKGVFTASAWK